MNQEKPLGVFSGSRISELFVAQQSPYVMGKTAQNYILDLASEVVTSERRGLSSKEMAHGIINQIEAFELIVKPLYSDAEWSDKATPINDNLWVTPDICIGDYRVDVKCPYYIDTFYEYLINTPKKFIFQMQTQLLESKGDEGAILYYLTSPVSDEFGNKLEYPFPITDRYSYYIIKKDEGVQEKILGGVEDATKKRDYLIEMMLNAPILDIDEFFYSWQKNKYRELKKAYNILNIDNIIRVNNKFYYSHV